MHGFAHTGLCRAGGGFQRSLCGQEKQGGLACHDEVNLQGEAYKAGHPHMAMEREERAGQGHCFLQGTKPPETPWPHPHPPL